MKKHTTDYVLAVMSEVIPRTVRQISLDSDISDKTVSHVIRTLRANGDIHIADYVKRQNGGGRPIARWVIGEGADFVEPVKEYIPQCAPPRYYMDVALYGNGSAVDCMYRGI